MKTYVGISRDHSASMRPLVRKAAIDYNSCISSIKNACLRSDQATAVSVVKCGAGSTNEVHLDFINKDICFVEPMKEDSYIANGTGTPLFDSVGDLIDLLLKQDLYNYNTFLVMVITDGAENASRKWSAQKLTQTINKLQATDRWTFTFRVPRGYAKNLFRFGIPEGNILEWDQTESGLETATKVTTAALYTYFDDISKGKTASRTFYASTANLKATDLKTELVNISDRIRLYHVKPSSPVVIKDFMTEIAGSYNAGTVFYQLTKTESRVQDYKEIVIRDKKKGQYYGGVNARDLLGLPHTGTVRVVPDTLDKYDIFIQSTSYNRKLVVGTTVLVKN